MAIVRDVTRQKEASEALRISEENYRTLVERAAIAILVIDGSTIIYANPFTTEICGYAVEELVGQDFPDFIAPPKGKGYPESRRTAGRDDPLQAYSSRC